MRNRDHVILENLYSGNIVQEQTPDIFEKYDGLGQSSEMALDQAIENVTELLSKIEDPRDKKLAKRAIVTLWSEKLHDWRMQDYPVQ